MKLNRKWMTITLFSAALWLGSTLYSNADGSVGTVNDPLVTKSYVDQKVVEIVKQQLGQGPIPPTAGGTTPPPTNTAAPGITVVQLGKGQTLYAEAGAELIVRTGKTLAVSSDENGIPDVTAGKDIQPGAPVETNHMLVFPREGRGVKADPKNQGDIYIMVRGVYTLYNADGTKATTP